MWFDIPSAFCPSVLSVGLSVPAASARGLSAGDWAAGLDGDPALFEAMHIFTCTAHAARAAGDAPFLDAGFRTLGMDGAFPF